MSLSPPDGHSRPPRVLITVPCLDLPGGVANYYRTLRPHLGPEKRYFEIGARPGESGWWAGVARIVRDYWRFHRCLVTDAVDLVHINPSLGPRSIVRDGLLLLIARVHGRPVLVFFRGWDPAFEARLRARHARLFRWVYGQASALVVLAEEFARACVEMGLGVPVAVETTVVADEVFAQPPGREPDRDGAGILFLSRLDRGKGLEEAIDAMAAVHGRFPAASLTIAGDGPERGGAEERVRARGLERVTFTGHLADGDRARAYRAASIFLFPSHHEGMPNAVLEAMAFGLPVITRAVGGLRDFFEDGRMGYITESRDPAVLAGLLGRLLADPSLRAAMGQYNRDYARRRFAASVVAARLLEIYGRVAGQGGAR